MQVIRQSAGLHGPRKTAAYTTFRKEGMKVSIFDRLISREPGGQERKVFHSIPYRRMFSELDESGGEARERYPGDEKTVEAFVRVLKEACRARHKKALDGVMPPIHAEARFFLSEDRMCAYGCLLPPENGGEGISLEKFLGDLHYEGVRYGVLQEDIPREFERGYLHIFPVARGKPPLAGEDGKVTELFQRRRNMRLEVQNGSEADFSQDVQLQPIRKGAVICLIRAPKAGSDGTDVTGQPLSPPQVFSARAPQGKNTELGRGGQALIAGTDGILYIENDLFCIHEQKIIDGSLDQFQGTLRISGNLYIGGNVDGGVEIEATGEIVINGAMGEARVTSSGGTIRVQRGIYGAAGKTVLRAAHQIQSPVVEWADIDAGTSVISETISNSAIRCGGTVYVMNGRGMIVDSLIQAGDSVLCLRVGNLAGGRSRFSVGYPPNLPETWKQLKGELAETQLTLDKLWDHVSALRRKGPRLSETERVLLEQLVEQRELYTQKREALTAELRTVNQALNKKTKGRIRCEKLFPFLDVQIGRLSEEVITIEENCDIHVEENKIVLE